MILNLVDTRESRATGLAENRHTIPSSLADVRKLTMPIHHDVRPENVDLKRLGAVLAVAHEQELRDFASFCFSKASARARCNRSLSLPRSCMVRPAASTIQQDSHSRTAARMVIHSLFR